LPTSKMKRLILAAALSPYARADPAPAIHYAPAESLEHVDVALIDTARNEIDIAAYVLTDWPVIQALTRAADRGVKVRIYLDGTQLAEREPARVFQDLAVTPGVETASSATTARSCTSRAMRLTAGCCARAPRTSQPQA
jgi:phosphatidylserine/phosphatidylglycerophosphate/cardiolipin synthase-like enzyme